MARASERGAALAIALFALTLVGALVAAAFFAGHEEFVMARYDRLSQRAFEAAEQDLADLLDGTGKGQVHRLNDRMTLLEASGTDRSRWARRRLGLLTRVRAPHVSLRAAVTTHGALVLQDGAAVGALRDSCGAADSIASVADDAAPLATVPVADLERSAQVVLAAGSFAPAPAVAWDGSCDTTVASNWGDAVASGGPCADMSRVVRVTGNAELSGGRGSGILVVDGDLTISGPVQYDGLIVVTGRVGSTSWGLGDARIMGALISGNPGASDQLLAGNVQVSYSNCSVNNALRLVARPQPLRSRAWIELF